MAIKDEDKKPALSKNAEANNSSKTYNSPVVSVYGQKGGEQHRLKFYHLPTKRSISFPAFLTSFGDSYTSNWAQENVYGRMDWDEVAPTITARFDSFTRGKFGHPEQDRSVSLYEGALLQTFPRDYVFEGNIIEKW